MAVEVSLVRQCPRFPSDFSSRFEHWAAPLFQDWPLAPLSGWLLRPTAHDGSAFIQRIEAVAAVAAVVRAMIHDGVGKGQAVAQAPGRGLILGPWRERVLAWAAMEWAARLVEEFCRPGGANTVRRQFLPWLERARLLGLGSQTLRFARAAQARDIPIAHMDRLLRLGWGANAHVIDGTFSDRISAISTSLVRHKGRANKVLAAAGLPVPRQGLARTVAEGRKIAQSLGWPVVVKPADLDQGVGVQTGIRTLPAFDAAFNQARKLSRSGVIVEEEVSGDDHRLLVLNGRLRAAARRVPGGVTGDGTATVAALLARLNADPRRGTSQHGLLVRLEMDDEARQMLAEQGLAPDAVPACGQTVRLRSTANISTGGSAEDVMDILHPDNRLLAERAARVTGVDVAGVDFLCPDISRSWHEVGGAVIEVNAQPGLRVAWLNHAQWDVEGEIIDHLFAGRPARIPTAIVAGTAPAEAAARLVHAIWRHAGWTAALCAGDGLWLGGDRVTADNRCGWPGAAAAFADPTVQTAIIHVTRDALAAHGHPCDRADVAMVVGIDADAEDGAHPPEAEILERATRAVVVNGEDIRCMAALSLARDTRCVLVARAASAVSGFLAAGGEAVFVADGILMVGRGDDRVEIGPAGDDPAEPFAVALAYAQDLPLWAIRAALAEGRTAKHA